MSEDWAAIQAEVAEAIASVGMVCTLRRVTSPQTNPYDAGTPTTVDTPITVTQGTVRVRDANGTFIGQTMRKLTMEAGVIEPLKSDTIAVNVAPDDVVSSTIFHDITDIEPLAPAGVVVKYGIIIAD